MSERYLGGTHYFAQKFSNRKKIVGMPPEPILEPDSKDAKEEKKKGPSRPIRLEPMPGAKDQKDSIIEQLQEETIQKDRELEKLRQLIANQTNEKEIQQNTSLPDTFINRKESQKNSFRNKSELPGFAKTLDPSEPDQDSIEEERLKKQAELERERMELERQKKEELQKLQEMQMIAQRQIEEVKNEKEKELKEIKERNEKQLQEMQEKLMAKFISQQEEEKTKLKKELELAAKFEKEKLTNELEETKKKLKQYIDRPSSPPLIEQPKPVEIPPNPTYVQKQPNPKMDSKIESKEPKIPPAVTNPPESKINQPEVKIQSVPETPREECYLYSNILSNTENAYKLLINGTKNTLGKIELKITMRCIDNPSIAIKIEVLDDENIRKLLKGIALNDVLPYSVLAKGVTTLSDIMRYGIMPFVGIAKIEENGYNRKIEIWTHAGGITKDNGFPITFLKSTCYMGLHYIEKDQMRITFTLIESETIESLCIDMVYDTVTFMKTYPTVNIEEHKEDSKEIWLPAFQSVTDEFLDTIDPALTELESYLRRTHRGNFSLEAVINDPSLRQIRLSIRSPNSKQVIWIVRENKNKRLFEIYSKSLYEVECNLSINISISNQ